MKFQKQYLLLLWLNLFLYCPVLAQQNIEPVKAFISIKAFVGKHVIRFRGSGDSPGASFGFLVSAGIILVDKGDYHGGLEFTLMEGASYNKERRELSESFERPHTNYDKHVIFNFAQFRSSTIGWYSQVDRDNLSFTHRIGFGIFGTTEKDQLFDFSMNNRFGLLTGNNPQKARASFEVAHDLQIGIGNPNYGMYNLALAIGAQRGFQ